MHGSVRGELENLLAAKPSGERSRGEEHIAACASCASEIKAMRVQAQMFKTLQSPADIEPAAGFYARVMQRIEERAKHSIWWVFVYSPVGKRLAYASLALSLALGSYVIAAESNDGHLTAKAIVAENASDNRPYVVPVAGTAYEQRAAVLQNFVSHPAPSSE